MKIRNGFVSNSSTTSFCAFAVRIEVDGESEAYRIEKAAGQYGLRAVYAYEDGTVCMGMEYETMPMDSTRRQFEAAAAQAIRMALEECGLDPAAFTPRFIGEEVHC